MKWLNSYRIRLVLVGFVAVIVIGGGNVKGDFTFGEPTNLGPEVNTYYIDGSPNISADGLSLFFNSNRPGGHGGRDLWMTTRKTSERNPEGYWSTSVNLGPPINTSYRDGAPDISADGRSLYFASMRSGGFGELDIWVTTRATAEDDWDAPVNLGSTVNSPYRDAGSNISADGLKLFFMSERPGGSGGQDLWVTTRATTEDDWCTPVNLGPPINTSYRDSGPDISADGLVLFFNSDRPGGSGSHDVWVSRRKTINDPWGEPANLGPTVNSSSGEWSPCISPNGSTLYYASGRPGGFGSLLDLWQVPIIPIVDLNGDGIIDAADVCIIVDNWGTDEPLCDIGPMPWGDGIVDIQDLIVLAEHLFEEIPPVEPVE